MYFDHLVQPEDQPIFAASNKNTYLIGGCSKTRLILRFFTLFELYIQNWMRDDKTLYFELEAASISSELK